MPIQRILELFARQVGGILTEEEKRELDILLALHPEHGALLEILQKIGSRGPLVDPEEKELIDQNWEKLELKLNEPDSKPSPRIIRRRVPLNRLMFAALCAGIILLTGLLYYFFAKPTGQFEVTYLKKISVPRGGPKHMILPDSTEVWVNGGSALHYNKDYNGTDRQIYLEGEAYFKVFHDRKRPFIVHAGNVSVKALGTEFNVHAYQDDSMIETTLIKGKVQVTMVDKPDQSIILNPNEKLSVKNKIRPVAEKGGHHNIEPMQLEVEEFTMTPLVNSSIETAWLQDKLVFEGEEFAALVKRMERRYKVSFVFRDAALKSEKLTGTFENENIGKALSLLQLITPFHYQLKGDTVYLKK